jgi:RimJ/RimL family protein N-acetyltransferase
VVILRPFDAADFSRLTGWMPSRELLVQWAGPKQFHFPLSNEQLASYLAESVGASPTRRIFTAVLDHQIAFGHVELGAIDSEQQTATLCRVFVAPEFRNQGLSLPMVREALRIGFSEMMLRRIGLRVYSFNTPAIRCYERIGFVREGLLRQDVVLGSAIWDTLIMSILRTEWEKL